MWLATGLFAYCVMEQIPEDSDLVLVEFGEVPAFPCVSQTYCTR